MEYLLALTFLFCGSDGSARSYIVAESPTGSWSWMDANAWCATEYGTELATVIDAEDIEALYTAYSKPEVPVLSEKKIWIGLNDNTVTGTWAWMDGTECTVLTPQSTADVACVDYWYGAEPNYRDGAHCSNVQWSPSNEAMAEDSGCTSANPIYAACNIPYVCDEPVQIIWEQLIQHEINKPSITYDLDVDDTTLSLTIDVTVPNLGKSAADDNGYEYGTTYVLDFEDFDAHSDDIASPGTCQNRDADDFSGKTFNEIWNDLVYAADDKWSITMDGCDVKYSATFTWDELTSCKNADNSVNYISTEQTADDITLSGTFYVNVVSPFDYNADYNFYRVYQLLSQPFEIVVSKTVYVIDSVGINLLTMDIISVYKEDEESVFKLVVLTESAQYLKLSRSDLTNHLFSLSNSVMDVSDFSVAKTAETATAASAVNGCLNNKGYICSQLWVITATDDECNVAQNRFTDFSGAYAIEYEPECRTEAELAGNDNPADLYEYCAGDGVDKPGWLNTHLDQVQNNADKVILSSGLKWKDEICDPQVFEVQFNAEMEFFVDGYTTAAETNALYQVGEDSVYVKITTNYPSDHLDVFEVQLENVWICTFDPLKTPKLDIDPGVKEGGGCFTVAPNEPDAVDPNDYKTHIYDRGDEDTEPTIEEAFVLDTVNTLPSNVIQFKFDVPVHIVRDKVYIHAQIEVILTSGRRRRMQIVTRAEQNGVNQIDHFVDKIGITKVPVDRRPNPNQYPQQPYPQPYTPPQQKPFVISLKSSWIMAIGGLLALILTGNIIYMCYINCIKGRGVASFGRRRRYTPVKDADSEFYSERDAINIVSE